MKNDSYNTMKLDEKCECKSCVCDDVKQSSHKVNIGCDCGCCDNVSSNCRENESFFKQYLKTLIQIFISICFIVTSIFINNSSIKFLLCIIAAISSGVELIANSVKQAINKQVFSENLLMLIAAITAFIIGESLEGALIITLFKLGGLLESVATNSSMKKIEAISKIKVEKVRLFSAKGVEEVGPSLVKIGSLIQVNRGERVPIDGVLLYGEAEFDTSAITGESKYVNVNAGETVYSGSINVGDSLIIKTTKLYEDSVSQRIVKIVEESLDKKSKCQRFISAFASKYTPIVCVLALVVAAIPPIFDGLNFYKWVYKALAFLVVSCPCALVISVPLAFFIGIGALAKIGVLIKSTICIENLSKVSTMVFDKTGTLTVGEFEVINTEICKDFDSEKILGSVAAIEKCSSHPIAKIIANSFDKSLVAKNVREILGQGLIGVVNDAQIAVGNIRMMNKLGITDLKECEEVIEVYIAVNGVFAGKIILEDKVKDNGLAAISSLKRNGIKNTVMLSGDKKAVAEKIGENIGIDTIYSQLLPEEKVEKIIGIKKEEKIKVAYVGDGINDSPALAESDVGIAMGVLGSDIAIESADIVLLDDDLNKISNTVCHSKKIMRTVKENIIFSLGVKFLVMILSVLFTIPMGLAMFADIGVMLLAVINSFKCNKIKTRP